MVIYAESARGMKRVIPLTSTRESQRTNIDATLQESATLMYLQDLILCMCVCARASVCCLEPSLTAGWAFASFHQWCWLTLGPPPLKGWARRPSLSSPHPTPLYALSSCSRPRHSVRTHTPRRLNIYLCAIASTSLLLHIITVYKHVSTFSYCCTDQISASQLQLIPIISACFSELWPTSMLELYK